MKQKIILEFEIQGTNLSMTLKPEPEFCMVKNCKEHDKNYHQTQAYAFKQALQVQKEAANE